jgi:hypothetical protein
MDITLTIFKVYECDYKSDESSDMVSKFFPIFFKYLYACFVQIFLTMYILLSMSNAKMKTRVFLESAQN